MRAYVRSRVALCTLALLPVHGACAPVEGGAVEVSWDLRGEDGTDRNCAEANIDRIKLEWDGPREASQDDFRCEDARGVTGFELGHTDLDSLRRLDLAQAAAVLEPLHEREAAWVRSRCG